MEIFLPTLLLIFTVGIAYCLIMIAGISDKIDEMDEELDILFGEGEEYCGCTECELEEIQAVKKAKKGLTKKSK
jgi:hypothetical protein